MTLNRKFIIRTISIILLSEGAAMIPALILAVAEKDASSVRSFAISAAAVIIAGLIGLNFTGRYRIKVKARDSYFVVLVCWLTAIAAGVLPYLLSGQGYTPIDSIFESVASWTTCSAWVIDINHMPRSLLLWKATSSWLGGMGVILIAILILSTLGVNAQKLMGAETPGPELIKSTARMKDTAKATYGIYTLFSAAEYILLRLGGLPGFHALINTMTTISTTGVQDYGNAVSLYFTPYVKVIIVIFSVISSLNFVIYLNLARGRIREAVLEYEMKIFIAMITLSGLFISGVLWFTQSGNTLFSSVVDAFAGTVSFSCTTGFTLERISSWPEICKPILLVLMIIGGCANSTSGGIKVIRFAVFAKLIRRGMYKRIHPNAVSPVMLRDKPVSALNVSSISCFVLLFFAVYLVSAIMLSLENLDMETTLSAPVALLTDTGVGFGKTADAAYTVFSQPGRLLCALLMLMGRLELYAILILFSRSFWNSDRIH